VFLFSANARRLADLDQVAIADVLASIESKSATFISSVGEKPGPTTGRLDLGDDGCAARRVASDDSMGRAPSDP
jgi:hypothetical protein